MNELILIRLTVLFQTIVLIFITINLWLKTKQIDSIYNIIQDIVNLEESATNTMTIIINDLTKLKMKKTLEEIREILEKGDKENGRRCKKCRGTKGRHEA